MNQINFENKSLYFTSLGCSKNLVDSQVMLGFLDKDGFEVIDSPQDAEVIIVNTCSFIEASKIESIDVVLEMADFKKRGKCKALVMSGCMAQRYSGELEKEMPEVDLFIGTGEYHKIIPLLKAYEEGKLEKKSFVEIPKYIHTEFDPRMNTSPFYTAWLKISEGCNRHCTFCIIPKLRGDLRSRTIDSLVQEAKNFVANGVRELNLISQDFSDYGVDLFSDNNIYSLLKNLQQIKDLDWLRIFYFYPDDLDEDVMELIGQSSSICHYLDMPVQHFSDKILRMMNRKVTGELIHKKIKRLRTFVPDIILRTSVIVGFPGETEEDFQLLLEGIKKVRFHHLGVFRYSDEEGTPAYKIQPKVDADIIEKRFQIIYETQKEIVRELNQEYLGQELEVLIEGPHPETVELIVGRHRGQAPEIDGKVFINDSELDRELKIGDIVQVKITEILDYDLVGTAIN